MKKMIDKNLLNEMKNQLLKLGQSKFSGRILTTNGLTGWRRIPAVSKYDIEVSNYNKILEDIGISLRLPMKPSIELTKFDKCNKYMTFQMNRIEKSVNEKNFKKAWDIAVWNIKFSSSFRMSALNYVLSGWYFNRSLSEVWKISRGVDKLIRNTAGNLDYKRVYIPKGNKVRPLGVPTIEWRIYLHMYNNMFLQIVKSEIGKHQHAYLPGKGVLSAWRDFIKRGMSKKYIYETDIKGYFPNISVWRIRQILQEQFQIPNNLLEMVDKLFKSTPKLPKEVKMDESKYNIAPNKSTGFYDKKNRKMLDKIFNLREEAAPDLKEIKIFKKVHVMNDIMDRHTGMWSSQGALELKVRNYGLVPGGVPQGMPLSPLLAILPLRRAYLERNLGIEYVNYADDQVFFSDKPFKIYDNPRMGIEHAKSKCGWVKYDGVWTKEGLKFLGFRLKDGKFISETRKGVKEEMNEKIIKLYDNNQKSIVEYVIEGGEEQISKNVSELIGMTGWSFRWYGRESYLEKIAKRNIFGFILACMNTGDWENEHKLQDKRKMLRRQLSEVKKTSWLGKAPSNLSSSSSLYALSFIIKTTMLNGTKLKKRVDL